MAKQAQQTAKPGVVARSTAYLNDVRSELAKVTWPTQEDLKASTTVVMIFLALLAAIIGSMDQVFQRLVLFLYSIV
jgi:preprotein translocase subunit SecE